MHDNTRGVSRIISAPRDPGRDGSCPSWARPTARRAARDVNMLDISVADGESGPVLVLTGECDFTTMSSVAVAVDRCLREGPVRVTVDLRAVTFCDCSAVRVLRHAQRRATAAGTCFCLTGLPAPVRRVLTLMQATTLLEAAGESAEHDDRDTRACLGTQPPGQRFHQDVPGRSPRHGG